MAPPLKAVKTDLFRNGCDLAIEEDGIEDNSTFQILFLIDYVMCAKKKGLHQQQKKKKDERWSFLAGNFVLWLAIFYLELFIRHCDIDGHRVSFDAKQTFNTSSFSYS